MNIRYRRWLLAFAALAVVALAISFAAAAALAEGAIHPILKRRPSDVAPLAGSIAHAVHARAIKVTITAKDGVRLNGWWLTPAESNGRGVIVCHGVADSAFGSMGYALLFLSHGYSVLVPESRGDGESGGFVTYGVLESDDTVRWVSWVRGHGVRDVWAGRVTGWRDSDPSYGAFRSFQSCGGRVFLFVV